MVMGVERRSTRSHFLKNTSWKKLWTCHKTYHVTLVSPDETLTRNTLKPARSQHLRPAACVIAQQYSSAIFGLLRFHSRRKNVLVSPPRPPFSLPCVLNWICWTPPPLLPNKIPGYATVISNMFLAQNILKNTTTKLYNARVLLALLYGGERWTINP
jgi:hypothetical protein